MTDYKQRLTFHLDRAEVDGVANLARRCSTTRQLLAVHAVRQALVLLRVADEAAAILLKAAAEGIDGPGQTAIYLDSPEAEELTTLAQAGGVTPGQLAQAAVRHLLTRAKDGVLPMMKPLEEAPPAKQLSWEELHYRHALWDAEQMDSPDDCPEQAPLRPARINFKKADYIVERLTRLAEEGIDPANPRAPLDDIDRLRTIVPPTR